MPYYLKRRKNKESTNPKAVRTKHGRIMLLSKSAVRSCKKSKLQKEQEVKGLLSSIGIRAPFSQVPLFSPLLFENVK